MMGHPSRDAAQEAAEGEQPSPGDGSITFTLTHPIPVFNDKVKELKFRKPTARDMIQIGNPVEFDPISTPPKINHNMERMAKMIARLANIPTSSVDFMTSEDLTSCAWALSPFFMPALGTI